ncbi:glycosyltransferase [bacterium]|nr:glycosyltransferase [bacterium]
MLTLLLGALIPQRYNKLIWGVDLEVNNRYWSKAMQSAGFDSQLLMIRYSGIYPRSDRELAFDDLIPHWLTSKLLRKLCWESFALFYVIRHAKVVHFSFTGGPLRRTPLWWLEAYILRSANIKTVIMPYGGDAYLYSTIADPSLRHGLLTNYPAAGRAESWLAKRVKYWTQHADVILTGFMLDGMSRWDVTIPNMLCIDVNQWKARGDYSLNDGRVGEVKVIHTPNHRGFKGTEFLIQAVQDLQAEGLRVELVLLEKVPNEQVRKLMQEVDILVEQLIFTGYALSGIEGMASGLPVMSNLEQELYTKIFRRYAFLNECPIVSTSPETIKRNLRVLVTNPHLRQQLGRAGCSYVEKYHSFATAQYLFGSIYDKILYGKDIDLMNLFHPPQIRI